MTNDTKAATDEQIDFLRRGIAQSKQQAAMDMDDMFSVSFYAIESLIARISALQSEIAALKAALDELLDWVNGERRTSDDRLAEIESMLPSKGSSHE